MESKIEDLYPYLNEEDDEVDQLKPHEKEEAQAYIVQVNERIL